MGTTTVSTPGITCERCVAARNVVEGEMADESLETVFSLVERAFVRMEAGEVLIHCLEKDDITPIQKFVEELVLTGPRSLNALREIRSEVEERKERLHGEITHQFSVMEMKLRNYDIQLSGLPPSLSLCGFEKVGFAQLLQQMKVLDVERQQECLRLIHEGKEVMSLIARQILLLEEMSFYLNDWMWGVIYQSAHQPTGLTTTHFTGVRFIQ
jgi:hypothetical protein